MSSETYLIAGLGNPGDKYISTRHNVGFTIVDEIASGNGIQLASEKWEAFYARASLWGYSVHLIKPITFMNLSGRSVSKFLDFYKLAVTNLIVIHDDLDMPTGRLKLVKGGGTGGHNGIRSIADSLGSNDFYRIKIGIGRPGTDGIHPGIPVDKYVLMPFSNDEEELISGRIAEVIIGLQKFFRDSPAHAMNYLNSFR